MPYENARDLAVPRSELLEICWGLRARDPRFSKALTKPCKLPGICPRVAPFRRRDAADGVRRRFRQSGRPAESVCRGRQCPLTRSDDRGGRGILPTARPCVLERARCLDGPIPSRTCNPVWPDLVPNHPSEDAGPPQGPPPLTQRVVSLGLFRCSLGLFRCSLGLPSARSMPGSGRLNGPAGNSGCAHANGADDTHTRAVPRRSLAAYGSESPSRRSRPATSLRTLRP